MSLSRFRIRTPLPVSAREAFAWHARPGAFERLNPPFAPVTVIERRGEGIASGTVVALEGPPLRSRWLVEHRDTVEGVSFRDVMLSGPFASWSHEHRFEPAGATCVLEDSIEFEPPLGWIGALAASSIQSRIARAFRYRHRVTRDDLAMHAAAAGRGVGALRVAVTGASGLLGSALCELLSTGGHSVVRIVRREARAGEARWDPESGRIDAAPLEALDAVVHLAGESIGERRWSASRRASIAASRSDAPRKLCESLARLSRPPRTFVSASAVGYYGDRDEETLDERAGAGRGFLADVGEAWESAPAPLEAAGARVVRARIGIVLTPRGTALHKMLLPYRFGAGGPLGSGRQWMSWIALDDAIGALHHAIVREDVRGAVNVVAPEAVRNATLARTLGRVIGRPALLPVPAFALRLVVGRDFANEALLSSQRVTPAVLEATGYAFRFPRLEGALRHVLGRTREPERE